MGLKVESLLERRSGRLTSLMMSVSMKVGMREKGGSARLRGPVCRKLMTEPES